MFHWPFVRVQDNFKEYNQRLAWTRPLSYFTGKVKTQRYCELAFGSKQSVSASTNVSKIKNTTRVMELLTRLNKKVPRDSVSESTWDQRLLGGLKQTVI